MARSGSTEKIAHDLRCLVEIVFDRHRRCLVLPFSMAEIEVIKWKIPPRLIGLVHVLENEIYDGRGVG
jgi:hypothetical protein